jgi:mRNA interferase RelE/StbE
MSYEVKLTNKAVKELSKLDKKAQKLVGALIDDIANADDPRTMPQAKKLQGLEDSWRWRCGTYRVLGRIQNTTIVIEIFRVGHRRDVYKHMHSN